MRSIQEHEHRLFLDLDIGHEAIMGYGRIKNLTDIA